MGSLSSRLAWLIRSFHGPASALRASKHWLAHAQDFPGSERARTRPQVLESVKNWIENNRIFRGMRWEIRRAQRLANGSISGKQ